MNRLVFTLLLAAVAQPAFAAASGRRSKAVAPSSPPAVGKAARGRVYAKTTREAATRPLPPTSKRKAGRASRAGALMSQPFPSGLTLPIVKGDSRRGQRHYDPTKSGNPLLDTRRRNRKKMVADNFSVGEFAHSGDEVYDASRIDPQLVGCLQSLRDLVDKPVWISSGYRTYWRNLAVYTKRGEKPTDSQHIAGKASDVKVDGMTGLQIAKAAIDACGPNVAVGVGLEFAHVDVRGTFGAWLYKEVPRKQLAEVRRYREAILIAQRGRARRPRTGGRARRT